MSNVANKLICLNLNSNWQPVGFKTVKDAIGDLCGSENSDNPSYLALNIDYELDNNGEPDYSVPKSMNPVEWSEWITLPVRSWDLVIKSQYLSIRVPTVIISKNYSKMPFKHFKGKPSKDAIYNRDQGVCQYSGKKIDKTTATIDHVVPKSRGGEDDWNNMVLCSRDINLKKGNKLNSEIGLNLLRKPYTPQPIPMYALIKEAKHIDWNTFLIK